MALPVTIPNTFANATSSIPLSQLDTNFGTLANAVNGINSGAETLANLKASNATITGGIISNVTLDNVTVNVETLSNITVNDSLIVLANTASTAVRITQTGAGNAFVVEDSTNPDASPFVIDSSGNVGIGTTAPARKLEVVASSDIAGQFVRTSSATNTAQTTINIIAETSADMADGFGTVVNNQIKDSAGVLNSIGNFGFLRAGADNSGAFYVATVNAGSSNERMRIDSSGNVGIGTTAPASLLHLSAASGNGRIELQNTSGTTVTNWRIAPVITGVTNNGFQIRDETQAVNRLVIDSNGNVGIGTNAPTYQLSVGAAAATGGFAWTSSSPNQDLNIYAPGRTGSWAGNIVFHTSFNTTTTSERMRITSAGEVLVGGTTSVNANEGCITLQRANAQPVVSIFRSDTSIVGGDAFGYVGWYGSDTTSNTPTLHAYIQAAASGTHDPGDNPTDLVFGTTPDGTGAVAEAGRITQSGAYVLKGGTTTAAAGVGIIFPATQVASANVNCLDDYEEGTFTPTISGSTAAGTGTYSVQVGRYTKIGNRVWVDAYIQWSAHTGTGNLRLSALPFTIANVTNYFPSATIGYINNITLTANNIATALGNTNTTSIIVYQAPTGGGASTEVAIDTAGSISYSISYEV